MAGAIGLFAILASAGARAEVPQPAPARLDAAVARFEALAEVKRPSGEPPRWSTPGDRTVLAAIWDKPGLLGAPPYRAADVPRLIEMNGKQIGVYKAYLFFTPTAGVRPNPDLNAFTYQDEVTRAADFMVAMVAANLTAIADFARTLKPEDLTPTRREGVGRIHAGITQLVSGFALMLRSPAFRPENRALLIESFATHADALAAGMARKDKPTMIAQIDGTLPALTEPERQRLTVFRDALLRGECDAVCALGLD